MIRRPPRSTRTDTLFPYTTLFRSRASVSVADNGLLLLSGPIVISPGMTDEAKQTVQCKVRVTDGKGDLIALSFIRSEEHTSELQSLMRISYAVFCLKKKHNTNPTLDIREYKTYSTMLYY